MDLHISSSIPDQVVFSRLPTSCNSCKDTKPSHCSKKFFSEACVQDATWMELKTVRKGLVHLVRLSAESIKQLNALLLFFLPATIHRQQQSLNCQLLYLWQSNVSTHELPLYLPLYCQGRPQHRPRMHYRQ